ncbi:MAG: hypothetical protein AB7T49_08365 [Oligoflexales bacterium]
MGRSTLGSLLVKEGLLSDEDRQTILRLGSRGAASFAKGILATGLLSDEELASYLAERTNFSITPKNFAETADPDAITSLDTQLLARLEVFPLQKSGDSLTVAMVDPLDQETLSHLSFFTNLRIRPVIAPLKQIHSAIEKVVPGFKPRHTQLESFLSNHVAMAYQAQQSHDLAPQKPNADKSLAQASKISKPSFPVIESSDDGDESPGLALQNLPPIAGDDSQDSIEIAVSEEISAGGGNIPIQSQPSDSDELARPSDSESGFEEMTSLESDGSFEELTNAPKSDGFEDLASAPQGDGFEDLASTESGLEEMAGSEPGIDSLELTASDPDLSLEDTATGSADADLGLEEAPSVSEEDTPLEEIESVPESDIGLEELAATSVKVDAVSAPPESPDAGIDDVVDDMDTLDSLPAKPMDDELGLEEFSADDMGLAETEAAPKEKTSSLAQSDDLAQGDKSDNVGELGDDFDLASEEIDKDLNLASGEIPDDLELGSDKLSTIEEEPASQSLDADSDLTTLGLVDDDDILEAPVVPPKTSDIPAADSIDVVDDLDSFTEDDAFADAGDLAAIEPAPEEPPPQAPTAKAPTRAVSQSASTPAFARAVANLNEGLVKLTLSTSQASRLKAAANSFSKTFPQGVLFAAGGGGQKPIVGWTTEEGKINNFTEKELEKFPGNSFDFTMAQQEGTKWLRINPEPSFFDTKDKMVVSGNHVFAGEKGLFALLQGDPDLFANSNFFETSSAFLRAVLEKLEVS